MLKDYLLCVRSSSVLSDSDERPIWLSGSHNLIKPHKQQVGILRSARHGVTKWLKKIAQLLMKHTSA